MFRLEQNNLFAATSLDKGGNDVAEILRKYRVVNPGRRRNTAPKRTNKPGQGRKQYRGSENNWLRRLFREGGVRVVGAGGAAQRKYYESSSARRGQATKSLSARTSNPSKKRMTLKQKLHFGTARQRAAAKAALSGARKRVGNPRSRKSIVSKYSAGVNRKQRKAMKAGDKTKAFYRAKASGVRAAARQLKEHLRIGNPAQIITLTNPGTPRKSKGTSIMAKRKTYKRHTVGTPRKRYTRRRNTGMSASRRHASKRYTRRHRNAGVLSSGFGQAFGIIGGGVVTSLITSRLPAGLNAGFAGYLSTAVVALVQGTLAGKVLKNQALGKSMTIGGFVYLGLRLVQDFVPNLQLPFRIGAIAPSSFYTPQVPMPNSMVAFQTPAAVTAAMPMPMAGTGGMGRVGRIGRAR